MLWERCSEPISDKPRSYHLGDVPKNTFWGSFGPLGPSRGICRPNRTANSRNKSCIGQIGAVWKCVLVFGGGEGPSSNSKTIQKFKNKPFCCFFFVLLYRVPMATGTGNILCRRGAPQAHCAAGAPRCRCAVPQARRSPQEAARGTSEARVTSAHPQGRVTDVFMRAAGKQRARCEESEAAGDR